MKRFFTAAMVACALVSAADARAEYEPSIDKGVKIELTKSGKQYFRILTWHQLWVRYDEHNPDSLVRGSPTDSSFDIGIRRSRVLMHGQLFRDLTIMTHFGINNQSTVGGGFGPADTPKKPQIFLHDVWGEYRIAGDLLAMGIGLHYWNGVSRIASASTINPLTYDSPIHNWATIDKTDQFARQFGVYFKGIFFKRLEYRMAINHPFATTGEPKEGRVDYDPNSNLPAMQGYYKFDFLETESNSLPYYAGTYLGKKKVFNVGAGFYWHPNSMAYLDGGEKIKVDTQILGIDTFLDLPLGWKGTAVTAYAGLVLQDFGPNYVRNIGLLNPATAIAEGRPGSFNGPGNAVPTIGTGTQFYGNAGFLFPDMGVAGQLQPYVALRAATFEGLADPVIVPDLGLNWFIVGHHAKLTLNYRIRPVFTAQPDGKPTQTDRKNEVTLQAQVFY